MIIFLDIDGVLCPNCFMVGNGHEYCQTDRFELIMRDFPECQIVITSGLREKKGLDSLRKMFSADIATRIAGVTPIIGLSIKHCRQREIERYLQAHNLIPFLSALDNVALAMQLNGVGKRESRKRARELLDYLEISHRADYMLANLSGGEQQRVAIGRALANEPPLIFADEPTASLVTGRGMKVMELLKRVAREKTRPSSR